MKLADIVTIIAIIFIVLFISFPMIKKIRSRETCCGTKKEKTPRKRLKHVAGSYILSIEGMRCKNCEREVAKAINSVKGLSAKVSLEKNEAYVSYENEPCEEEAIDAVQKLDFVAYLKD